MALRERAGYADRGVRQEQAKLIGRHWRSDRELRCYSGNRFLTVAAPIGGTTVREWCEPVQQDGAWRFVSA
jgi:hypothetical protein